MRPWIQVAAALIFQLDRKDIRVAYGCVASPSRALFSLVMLLSLEVIVIAQEETPAPQDREAQRVENFRPFRGRVWHDPKSPAVIYPTTPQGRPIFPGIFDPNRPDAEQDMRRRQIPDPAFVHIPHQVVVRIVSPSDTGITLFGSGGKRLDLPNTVLAAFRTRATYAFALRAGLGDVKAPFYGTIEVIRGPHRPPDLSPRDAIIPIAFDEQDVMQVLRDRMITKFILLEDPATALDYPSSPNLPIRYEETFAEDAVKRAKELGKILIVVRIGNRIPTEEELATIAKDSEPLVGKVIEVVDADGKPRQVEPEFVGAGDYPNGPIQQVHFRLNSKCDTCQKGAGHGGASASEGEMCNADSLGGNNGGGPDYRRLLNNDLTYNFEYLCDGGDGRPRAGWVTGGELVNVDPEDTVAEYQVADGGKRLAVSNRVCIFAPRYVEARVVRMVDGYDTAIGYGALYLDRRPEVNVGMVPPDLRGSYQTPGLVRIQKRPKGLIGTQWASEFTEVRVLAGFREAIGWAELVGLFGPHHLTGTQQPEIAARVTFADTLTLDMAPQMVGMVAGTGEVVTVWKSHEVRGVEVRPEANVLRLEKTANRSSAEVGVEVMFAIRYTNLGSQPVSNISITDSLTARLEYVPESAESDRPAVFTAKPNEAGSTMLRWEIKDPLPPGEFGIVKFTTKVR